MLEFVFGILLANFSSGSSWNFLGNIFVVVVSDCKLANLRETRPFLLKLLDSLVEFRNRPSFWGLIVIGQLVQIHIVKITRVFFILIIIHLIYI